MANVNGNGEGMAPQYVRIEAAFNRGLDKLQEQNQRISDKMDAQHQVVLEDITRLREKIAKSDAQHDAQMHLYQSLVDEVKKAQNETIVVEKRISELERAISENKGRDRLVTGIAALIGGGIVSGILLWLGRL